VTAKAAAAARHSRVDVAIWGGLTPLSVGQVDEMIAAGVVGLKAFACPSGWDDFPPVDEPALRHGAAAAARHDLPVAVHCELEELGHAAESEVAAVRWAAGIVHSVGARLHVVHVSAADAVDEARRWAGTTVETCPHYLFLADDDRVEARCAPPVRDAGNRDALWARLLDGRIDWIASDHSPCPPVQRQGPTGWAGIDGVGMTLPLLLSSRLIDPPTVARLTTAAAKHLRLPGKGAIKPGYDADLALVDPDATWTVEPTVLYSRHKSSPFLGQQVKGRVEMTLLRGRVTFSILEGPSQAGGAQFLRPDA
jgi:allantoinase